MRRGAGLLGIILLLVGAALAPAFAAGGARAAYQYPNLIPLPASDLQIGLADEDRQRALRFAATIWNEGDFAFELLGRPGDLYSNELEAEQCVSWPTPRTCAERRSVGKLIHHDAHGHWHFEDFALYEIRRFRRDRSVDMTPRGLVATSGKVSFCLQDVDRREDDSDLAPWPLYYGCLGGMGVMGISSGWTDIYSSALRGQFIPLAGVRDGRYALVIHTDPGKRVFESNDADNVSVAGITLSNQGQSVDVFCQGGPGTLTCDQPPSEGT